MDRRKGELSEQLRAACPDGVDAYIELTGGEPFWATLPLMNVNGRIPVVGSIAWYNLKELPAGPDRSPLIIRTILTKRLRVQGMIVWDYAPLEAAFRRDMASWVRDGSIRYKEDVVDGLENAPEAFLGMLKGNNFGKLLVRVDANP